MAFTITGCEGHFILGRLDRIGHEIGMAEERQAGAVDAYDPAQDRFVSIEERYGLGD